MSRLTLVLFSVFLVIFSAGETLLQGKQRIAVSSKADPAYESERSGPETYVISKGNYFPGGTRDKSMSAASFDTILSNLAKDLAKRDYFPGDRFESADLLIVVHWGVTIAETAESELAEYIQELYNAAPDPDSVMGDDYFEKRFGQLLEETQELSAESRLRRNARLLGFEEELLREQENLVPSERERLLREQLLSDRYFLVLLAWDNRLLQRTGEKKLLWSMRLSVRSPGTNFEEAMPLMAIAASDFFGRNTDGLISRTFRRGKGDVTMGEVEVLSVEDPSAPEDAGSED